MMITVVCAAAAVFIYRVVVDISLLVNFALLTTALLQCKDKCGGKASSDNEIFQSEWWPGPHQLSVCLVANFWKQFGNACSRDSCLSKFIFKINKN